MKEDELRELLTEQIRLSKEQFKVLKSIDERLEFIRNLEVLQFCWHSDEEMNALKSTKRGRIREIWELQQDVSFAEGAYGVYSMFGRFRDQFLKELALLPLANAKKRFWGEPEKQVKEDEIPKRDDLLGWLTLKDRLRREASLADYKICQNFDVLIKQLEKTRGDTNVGRIAQDLTATLAKAIRDGVVESDDLLTAFISRKGSPRYTTFRLESHSFDKIILALDSMGEI